MSAGAPVTAAAYAPPDALGRIRTRALVVGVVAGAITVLLGLADPAQFFRSYLVAYIYWLSIALGCFAIAMLHHLSRGVWGLMVRRILEAASRTLPVLALLLLPLLFGLDRIYPWARPGAAEQGLIHEGQQAYLNVPFFIGRALFYLAIWWGLAAILNRLSLRQDQNPAPHLARRMQQVSAAGLALYALTATFASIDWLMSLDPRWYSTIYGFYFVGGQALSGLAFMVIVALFLSRREPMSGVFRPEHFHDYGKLLLTFVVLWAYFAASQLIIVWQGNVAHEVTWYEGRLLGAWRWVSLFLILLHFALPFVLLLSRDLKRNVVRLSVVAILVLAMRWVDLFWLAAPAFYPDHVALHWLDLAAPVALGGIWIGVFAGELGRRPLLPVGDPFLKEALGHG